jgi:TRAP-type uncharacterized transport system substrate-binding protein
LKEQIAMEFGLRVLRLCALSLGFLLLGHLSAPPAAQAQSQGIATKKPVFAGACVFCPWGELGEFTRDAMKPYGYDVQVCYNCNLVDSPRFVTERRVAPPLTDRHRNVLLTSTRPDGEVGFGVTDKTRAYWAYHGAYDYKDDKMGKRLRLIAMIDDPTYIVVAVRTNLGSTDLKEILFRKNIRLRSEVSPPVQVLLAHYGTSKDDIISRGGKIEVASGLEPKKEDFDLIITASGSLANNPEANAFYDLLPHEEVVYLPLPDALRDRLAKEMGYARVNLPVHYFRGIKTPVATAGRTGQVLIARDDAPDEFVYDVAKAVDAYRDNLKWFIRPYSYDSRTVWKAFDIPLHPGAARYYREAGYMK